MGIDAEMFVRTKEPVTREQVLLWAYHAGSSFGHDRFWIFEPSEWSPEGRHALQLIDVYEQDGPDIVPEPGETFIRVNPSTRYYGDGYERGDLPFLIMLAEWLERVIPGAEVWYGGDSSGVLATKFDKEERDRLFAYFCEVAHHPYQGGFGRWATGSRPECPRCHVTMTNFGGGQGKEFYSCTGCGKKAIVRGSEVQWLDARADFFEASKV